MVDIMIDAGHGGSDPGAIGPTGVQEKDITLILAMEVGSKLADRGLEVGFTRASDKSMTLAQRVSMANFDEVRYFLSIHINSAINPIATGTETYAYAPGGPGEKLAQAVQKNLVAAIGLPDRGVKFNNFYVLRGTDMPAILTEVNFICNPKEEAMLKDNAFLDKAATGIAKGVVEFLGLKWERPSPSPNVDADVPQWQRDGFQKLVDAGIINSPEYWEPKLKENITVGELFGILGKR